MRMKVCRMSGCNELVSYEQENPFCTKHASYYKPRPYQHYNKWERKQLNKDYNRNHRDKEANDFYHSVAWRKLSRVAKERAYMTCECCGHTALGKGKLVVDHITPRRIDKRKQLDSNNLWVLCYSCHYWKGQLEQDIYEDGDENFISNLDVATQWDRESCREWILGHKR
ncbi:HNH endonuclease [Lactiplantibacillus pentosus]|uniref:HNH endonuclease n=2 Tax=Lactiplantibacillus pentosus TaxID=1589 RepID=UPI001FD6BFE6|nr:HNH endonuclease signature motif containing protein [Lactiplantibacillus pentosus]MCJ8184798.1 HNH endonuclease [Lactiplantibacillus pentosus]